MRLLLQQLFFQNAAQAHPKVDWIYVVFSILLPPASIPPEYKKAVYIGDATPVMITGLKDGIVKAALPVFPISVGYVGIAYAVKKLNGEELPKRTCIPNAAYPGDDESSRLTGGILRRKVGRLRAKALSTGHKPPASGSAQP